VKLLLTGAGGQVASAVLATAPGGSTVIATTRAQMDITRADVVRDVVARIRPDWIVNAAAFTAVDRAETEQVAAEAINVEGPALLARAATACGSRMLHVSTDFVFAGDRSLPYEPACTPAPINVYGATKLGGELAVRNATSGDALVLRTSWVYAARGSNFVLRMLDLMRTRPQVAVVADQVGAPTWARSVAECIWGLLERSARGGVFHWSDAGAATWYDFAVAIQEEAMARHLLEKSIPVRAIRTAEYPTAARRPANSMLDWHSTAEVVGHPPEHWRRNLRKMLDELRVQPRTHVPA
jgi:dTDP-4-dehydrorhamnose reductase